MKATNFGTGGLPVALGGWSTGVTAISSNAIVIGGLTAQNFVQRITANSSNTLQNPIVNFAAGSGVSLAVASNTITISSAAGGGTYYPPPVIAQEVSNGFTSGTSIVLTVVAPASGQRLIMFVASTGRVCNSITQTNVTWTQRLTNNGNSKYVEIWTGVVTGAAGTSVTLAFTGTNDCAATFIELASTYPAFTAAGTPATATAASGVDIKVGPLTTAAGDYWVWGVAAGQASSYSVATQGYIPLQAFGGFARFGFGRSNGGKIALFSITSASNAYNGVMAVLS